MFSIHLDVPLRGDGGGTSSESKYDEEMVGLLGETRDGVRRCVTIVGKGSGTRSH